jgi:hypothetical protein
VSPVKFELGFYIPEGDILHSHCRENHKSYIVEITLMLVPNSSRYHCTYISCIKLLCFLACSANGRVT